MSDDRLTPRRLIAACALAALLAPIVAAGQAADENAPEPTPPSTGALATSFEPEVLRIDKELKATRIQEGVWVITHRLPYPANSLVVEGDDGSLLLVDTPWTADATTSLLKWLDEKFDSPPKTAVNTHFHLDALGGNPALRDARVPTRGHYYTLGLLRHKGAKRVKELRRSLADRPTQRERFRNIELVAPAQLFAAQESGHPLGSESYKIIHPGHAHSLDNLVVYLPQRKVLFAGCVARTGDSLGPLGDADLESWPSAIEMLKELDAEIVVPGHGSSVSPRVLDNTLALLAEAGETAEPESPEPSPEAEDPVGN